MLNHGHNSSKNKENLSEAVPNNKSKMPEAKLKHKHNSSETTLALMSRVWNNKEKLSEAVLKINWPNSDKKTDFPLMKIEKDY